MIIEERKITVGEVCEGYFNDAEEGVVGYNGRCKNIECKRSPREKHSSERMKARKT